MKTIPLDDDLGYSEYENDYLYSEDEKREIIRKRKERKKEMEDNY